MDGSLRLYPATPSLTPRKRLRLLFAAFTSVLALISSMSIRLGNKSYDGALVSQVSGGVTRQSGEIAIVASPHSQMIVYNPAAFVSPPNITLRPTFPGVKETDYALVKREADPLHRPCVKYDLSRKKALLESGEHDSGQSFEDPFSPRKYQEQLAPPKPSKTMGIP